MHTIIGSPGRDCILIILFQVYGSRDGVFEGYFILEGQYDHQNFHIGRKTNTILIYLNTFLSNLSKLIPSQKTADIIL